MNILLITLACATLSHATVLRWIGLTNDSEETPLAFPPQPVPVQTPHVVLQTSPSLNHQLLHVRYIGAPTINIRAPRPLNLLSLVHGRRPFPGPVFVGAPLSVLVNNGHRVIGKPAYVEHEPISTNTNSVQYLSHSSDLDNNHPVYNHYPYQSGHVHTAAELVRPAFTSGFRPGFSGIDVSNLPQQYPIPSSTVNTNNNNIYVPPTQHTSPVYPSQPLQYPSYQHLPYPAPSNDFGRPNYEAGLVSNSQESAGVGHEESLGQLGGSIDSGFSNNIAFPSSTGGTQNVDQHSYELENGTKVSEQTNVVTSADGSSNELVKTGEYEYIDENGKVVKVKWIADDNGFRTIQ